MYETISIPHGVITVDAWAGHGFWAYGEEHGALYFDAAPGRPHAPTGLDRRSGSPRCGVVRIRPSRRGSFPRLD